MGELAALATSALWSFTSIQFTLAGRRVSSPVVNRARLVAAVLFLALFFGERVTWRAVVGTVMALAGATLILLFSKSA